MITNDQKQAILDYVTSHNLSQGVGTAESACSIAAINLALTNTLTDAIPDCMSEVIGRWIIVIQDAMPDEMRNSAEWKCLLPLAAGTGRDREEARLAIILEWLWGVVLPLLQEFADKSGFGEQWRKMLLLRTVDAAHVAADAAHVAAHVAADAAAADAAAAHAADAADAAHAARSATAAADARSAAHAARSATAAADAHAAAHAAHVAADAAAHAAAHAARSAAFWKAINPCSLLEKLCK